MQKRNCACKTYHGKKFVDKKILYIYIILVGGHDWKKKLKLKLIWNTNISNKINKWLNKISFLYKI